MELGNSTGGKEKSSSGQTEREESKQKTQFKSEYQQEHEGISSH